MQVMNNFIITEESKKADSPSNLGIYVPTQESEVVQATVSSLQTGFDTEYNSTLDKLKGKKVFYHRGHGLEVTYNGSKYTAVKLDDIICCCD